MLTLKDVNKAYIDKSGSYQIIKNLTLEIRDGDFLCIYGKSGCGKTTLLNILGLLDGYDSGIYCIDDHNIKTLTKRELSRMRLRKFGFVFQAYYLIPELNVLENVGMSLGYANVSRRERKERCLMLLEQFGIGDKAKKYPDYLSGGEKQRVAIARAIANEPTVIFADEPTGNLDEENGQTVLECLKTLNEKGTTIVMVTHDETIAKYSSRIVYMENGRLLEEQH